MSLNQKMILIIAMLVGGMFVGIAGALAAAYWLVGLGAALMVGSLIFFLTKWACPHCGWHLGRFRSGMDYCPHCGERLDFNERTGRKP